MKNLIITSLVLSVWLSAQAETGIPVVVENWFIPGFFLVTVLAFFAETTCVDVPDRVAACALRWRIFELAADVASVTAYSPVRKLEPEVGPVVIELRFAPVVCGVAQATVFSEPALVRIIVRVTAIAAMPGFAVLAVLQMAGRAFGKRVFPIEAKVGQAVIELVPVQPDDPGISPLVIAMAGFTFETSRVFIPAMESVPGANVFINLVVTIEA